MGDDGTGAVDAAADELYGLALDQFLPRRAELVKAARAAGDKAAATEIGALRKPTVPAWLVNLVAREAADDLDALLQLGEQLREAQSQLLGPRIKELSKQANAAVQGLSRRASELAESRGQSVTAATDRDIEQTLRAALADPQAELAVASGRLTRALAYAGFGEVDVTAATATPLERTTARPVGRGEEGAGAAEAAAGGGGAVEAPVPEERDQGLAADEDASDQGTEAAPAEPTAARLTSVGGRSTGGSAGKGLAGEGSAVGSRAGRDGSQRTRSDRASSDRGPSGAPASGRATSRGAASGRAGSDRPGSKATGVRRGPSTEADREEAARARAEAARAEEAAARAEHERAMEAAEEAQRAAREAEALVGELQERLAQARRDAADAVRAADTARRTKQRAARAAREAAAALRMATRSSS
jgi:hypothetical protein